MAKRYLVMKLRHHGDVLLITPLIRVLKQHDANCEIDVLIYRETRDMLAAYADIHHIHLIDRNWKKLGVKEQIRHEWALAQAIRNRHYDVVVCLADQWRAALLAKYSAAPVRIGINYGHRQKHARLWRGCFTDMVAALPEDRHTVEQNLLPLTVLGIKPEPLPPLVMAYYDADAEAVRELLTAQGWQGEAYVAVHPGSRWFFKCWDDDKFAAVLQHILQSGISVVLSAAPDEREQAMLNNIVALLSPDAFTGRLYTLSGCLNLRQLAALIDKAALFVGVDSVPMHMAAALDTPCIALFGPTKLAQWRPWNERAKVIYAGDYGSLPHPDSIDVTTSQRYLSAIPAAAVWQAVQAYLSELNLLSGASS